MKGGFVPCSYCGTLHLRANGIFAFGAHLTVDLCSLLDGEGLSFFPGLAEEFLGKTLFFLNVSVCDEERSASFAHRPGKAQPAAAALHVAAAFAASPVRG